ncbi:hypothetical protein Godav_013866 [Gossypium davidsonii]|uniref:Uncharacterized protein n=2 Tax=Gossypium TaxID=3633 RepID=A0A7J8RHV8_GOSDV|nr:hypothetical protein [Gossypium davidsonii]MBA0648622.1 hypothetical protein [Gossypium klotzschianum]
MMMMFVYRGGSVVAKSLETTEYCIHYQLSMLVP